MKRSFCGFTLAEVLITLGIIGVVAAMTIPTLVANYQKTQYVAQLKKMYVTFNSALIQLTADQGTYGDLRSTGVFAAGSTDLSVGDELVKYFKVTKNCQTTDTGCFSNKVSIRYDGNVGSYGDYDASLYRFITADGAAFRIENSTTANCGKNYSNGSTGHLSQICGWVYMDTNGPTKGPNYFGRDIFYFYITNGKGASLYPYGGADDDYYAWWNLAGNKECVTTQTMGLKCAARIMEEGWQMNY